MGFGFNFFLIFMVLPITVILLIIWLITRKKIFVSTVGSIWIGIVGFALLSVIVKRIVSKTELKKENYYGQYIIDRDYFPGKQSDWQYDNFRFEIKENDSIYFYVTNKERIVKTYRGTVSTTMFYKSERLIVNIAPHTHHILTSNPTTYRDTWSFYLVFNSPKFNNVYFKKGKWEPLNSDL